MIPQARGAHIIMKSNGSTSARVLLKSWIRIIQFQVIKVSCAKNCSIGLIKSAIMGVLVVLSTSGVCDMTSPPCLRSSMSKHF
ncbi:hypothetical protein I7I53_11962 [Histoplasma capsulatum var. duboisii H88]|uniref:Uncharacterized protein n=1 Tax=Ajellomyces capsulatus (strain H88) TaxID=544711 RepID=A0A8A1LZ66_AJEC8|nr:hypothetical protein I7I53_11962 [Histoplasma capsulatum var. duboisii H88]